METGLKKRKTSVLDFSLIFAIDNLNINMVSSQMLKGVDPNLEDEDDNNALAHALKVSYEGVKEFEKKLLIIDELLGGDSDPNSLVYTDDFFNGISVLEYAIEKEEVMMIKMLLDHGADPNTKDSNNDQLVKKILYTFPEGDYLIKHFVKKGLDVYVKSHGETVYDFLIKYGKHPESIKLIKKLFRDKDVRSVLTGVLETPLKEGSFEQSRLPPEIVEKIVERSLGGKKRRKSTKKRRIKLKKKRKTKRKTRRKTKRKTRRKTKRKKRRKSSKI